EPAIRYVEETETRDGRDVPVAKSVVGAHFMARWAPARSSHLLVVHPRRGPRRSLGFSQLRGNSPFLRRQTLLGGAHEACPFVRCSGPDDFPRFRFGFGRARQNVWVPVRR